MSSRHDWEISRSLTFMTVSLPSRDFSLQSSDFMIITLLSRGPFILRSSTSTIVSPNDRGFHDSRFCHVTPRSWILSHVSFHCRDMTFFLHVASDHCSYLAVPLAFKATMVKGPNCPMHPFATYSSGWGTLSVTHISGWGISSAYKVVDDWQDNFVF